MARWCPELNRKVLYLDCQECEEKTCRTARTADYETAEDASHQEYRSTGRDTPASTSQPIKTGTPYQKHKSGGSRAPSGRKHDSLVTDNQIREETLHFFENPFHFVTGQPPKGKAGKRKK